MRVTRLQRNELRKRIAEFCLNRSRAMHEIIDEVEGDVPHLAPRGVREHVYKLVADGQLIHHRGRYIATKEKV